MSPAAARRGLLGRGAAALLAAAAAGCLQDDGRRFNPLRPLAPPDEQDERALGARFDAEIRKHVLLIDDPVVAGFANDLGQELAATLGRQPFVYRFRVVRHPALNAFAVPGGYVYLHSGTIAAAGSIDELAGVIGHEIGHVKARHFARMQARAAIPDLLGNLAGLAAAVATGEPGLLVATQAANVAMQLRFNRELEEEADRLAIVYTSRAGYRPTAINRFFERVLAEQRKLPAEELPPYLYSHPDVEQRIEAVAIATRDLGPTRSPEPGSGEAFAQAQAQLALLLARDRASLPRASGPRDPETADALRAEAERLAGEGEPDAALEALARAEAAAPGDPRVPFRAGELLAAAGRHPEAVAAYRRTLALDPTRALVFFRLGKAYAALGRRGHAVFAFEQARDRTSEPSALRQRAEWELAKQGHEVLTESGVGPAAGKSPVPGSSSAEIPAGTERVGLWARLSPRFESRIDRISVRWIDPAGIVRSSEPVRRLERPYVGSVFELPTPAAAGSLWTVELRIDDEPVDRHAFRVQGSR